MKRLILVFIAALFLVQCAYAFEIPFTDIKILEPTDLIINEASPVLVEPALDIKTTTSYEEDKTLIDTVFRFSGMTKEGTRNITVMLDGKFLGSIWGGSKFENLPVHKICLTPLSQYGTEEWYACEVNLK